VRSGTTVLNHSAAGGVGQLLNQMAKHKGARIIGTVGSEEKVAIARASGCDEVIVLGQQDIVTEARRFTGGLGVDVAYDSVGKDTFQKSLDCIRPLGMIVNFGQSSGPVPPLDISILAQKGSIFLAKPTLATFMASPAMRQELADEFFTLIKDGVVKINISRRAKLDEVASVHRDLEARKSAGAIVLKP
jgi:NADPH2:quinone reductase